MGAPVTVASVLNLRYFQGSHSGHHRCRLLLAVVAVGQAYSSQVDHIIIIDKHLEDGSRRRFLFTDTGGGWDRYSDYPTQVPQCIWIIAERGFTRG